MNKDAFHHPSPDQKSTSDVRVPPELTLKREKAVLEEQLAQAKQEAAAAKEQYVRETAELENTKKRLHREKDEFAKYAAELVLRELLPIIDGLNQAVVAVDKPTDPQAVVKGVHLIYRQLLGLLEKEGIKRIPTVGERFDPHQHEAVEQVEPPQGVADGTIVEEVHAGYTMHGKVIRPALVKVAKSTDQKSEDRGQKSENL